MLLPVLLLLLLASCKEAKQVLNQGPIPTPKQSRYEEHEVTDKDRSDPIMHLCIDSPQALSMGHANGRHCRLRHHSRHATRCQVTDACSPAKTPTGSTRKGAEPTSMKYKHTQSCRHRHSRQPNKIHNLLKIYLKLC